MFDIGFWELAVIGAIALLVVGPERLPALARNVGLWVGRIRRYVSHVKQDIERELHADEVRQLIEKPGELDSIRDVARDTASVFEDTRKAIDDVGRAGTTPGADDAARSANGGSGAHTSAQASGQASGLTSDQKNDHDSSRSAQTSAGTVTPPQPASGGGEVADPSASGDTRTPPPSEPVENPAADDEQQPGRQGQG